MWYNRLPSSCLQGAGCPDTRLQLLQSRGCLLLLHPGPSLACGGAWWGGLATDWVHGEVRGNAQSAQSWAPPGLPAWWPTCSGEGPSCAHVPARRRRVLLPPDLGQAQPADPALLHQGLPCPSAVSTGQRPLFTHPSQDQQAGLCVGGQRRGVDPHASCGSPPASPGLTWVPSACVLGGPEALTAGGLQQPRRLPGKPGAQSLRRRGREGVSRGLEAHSRPQPSPPNAGRRKAGGEAGAEARRQSPKNGRTRGKRRTEEAGKEGRKEAKQGGAEGRVGTERGFGRDLLPPGFPGGSDGEASAYSAGNSGWTPGWGRCPGEGNGNPL